MGPKYIGVMTLTFLGHVTSTVTLPFESQWVISYWWAIGPKSLSPAVFGIFGVKNIGVRNLTFLGHVTPSTWSIVSKSLSPAVFEIFGPKYIKVTTLTFLGHVTSSVT